MEDTTKNEILGAIQGVKESLESSIQEVGEAVQELASEMDSRFQGVDHQFHEVRSEMKDVKIRLTRLEMGMVTKEYLDDKLADHHSDIIKFVQKRVPEWAKAAR